VGGAAAAPAAEGDKVTYVDLSGKTNHKLSEKFGNDNREGNFLTIATGEQTLEGVKLKVGDGVIQLGSKVLTEQPEKVEGIKVGKKFAKLYILHATGYGGGPNAPGSQWYVEDGTDIGEYKVHYDDNTTETIPIVYGKDVRDWWSRADEEAPSRAKVAWKGDNDLAKQYDCRLRLYLTTWKNPKPDKKVVAIDYVGRKDDTVAAPFCVAMSVE
jgi:beta-galactosidase